MILKLPASLRLSVRVPARLVALFAAAMLAACASGEPPPFRTVPGPESPGLLAGIAGRVAISEGRSTCYPLQDLDARTSRCIARPADVGWDSAIAPRGDRAVLRLFATPSSTALQGVADCHGGEPRCVAGVETISTWTALPGADPYHQPLALSPDGRWAAVVPSSHLLKGPGYSPRLPSDARFHGLRHVGELMLVDLQTHRVRDAGIEVVGDQPLSWSADGRRLLIVRAEPREALPSNLASDLGGDVGHPGQGVPVVETWDVESGTLTMLAVGLQPLWSPDQRTLLFQPAHDRLTTLDLAAHVQRDLELPGMSTRYEAIAIAFVAPREVLYWALPTAGVDPTSRPATARWSARSRCCR